MMWDKVTRLRHWFIIGNRNLTINLQGIATDNFSVNALTDIQRYFGFADGGWSDDKNKGRALTLIDDLKGTGQYAYVIETAGPDGQTYYRVRVGQMSSLNDAEDLKKRLDKLGYPTLIYP